MIAVHRVAATREVHVVLLVAVNKGIVNAVFKSTEVQCNPVLVSFCSVIVNNIKDYFDSGLVEFLNKILEFVYAATRSFVCGKRSFRRKEVNGAVAPVVLHSFACARIYIAVFIFIEFKNRQKLNCSNSKFLKVRNLLCKTRICSRKFNTGIFTGSKSLKVNFVNDAFGKRPVDGSVPFPIEFIVIDYNTLWEQVIWTFFHLIDVNLVHYRLVAWW